MTPAAGIFLTHHRSPRIRRHFERLVRETGDLVTWHFIYNDGPGARPKAPFAYEDPARVLPTRYQTMVRNGGVYGGYLDTLFVPVIQALSAEHVWLIEYDVDYSGSWGELFDEFRDNDADLLTTSVMYKSEHPQWPHWKTATTPSWVRDDQLVRSLNPLMRVSQDLLNTYAIAMSDPEWYGTYEWTLSTIAYVSGAVVEDLGNQGSFTPAERSGRIYIGKSPAGTPEHMTFRFRPAQGQYFHESPAAFAERDMVYHPVKPGVEIRKRAPSLPREL